MMVEYLFDYSGNWIAFKIGKFLYNEDGDWIGWFPYDDKIAVDTDGEYLGAIYLKIDYYLIYIKIMYHILVILIL